MASDAPGDDLEATHQTTPVADDRPGRLVVVGPSLAQELMSHRVERPGRDLIGQAEADETAAKLSGRLAQ